MKKSIINESEVAMKPYIEAGLHDLIEEIKVSTDVADMTFEEAYLLLKEKIKEKQIPVEIYYDPIKFDPKCLYILDMSELTKPIKIVHEGIVPPNFEIGAWRIC